jgi:hypothetical protein
MARKAKERDAVLRRTEARWILADQWVPDSPRKVIVLVHTKTVRLKPMEARWAGGAWRFIHDRHPQPRDGRRVHVWMDIPWWDRYAEESKSQAAATAPPGATSREQSETEAQTACRPHGVNAREEAGLAQAEAEFEG